MNNKLKLIIGLGNPGTKYQDNRHNLGFLVIDAIAKKFGVKFKNSEKFYAEMAEIEVTTGKIMLAKPATFVNDSGKSVEALLNFYKLDLDNILIVQDEIDLPFGKIRLSKNAGSAGHRGIQSIIEKIGRDFARLRIGIENRKKRDEIGTEDYVLQRFAAEEKKELSEKIIPAAINEITPR